jgi:pyruvate,water dikinase
MVFAYVFYHLASEIARHAAPRLVRERADLTVGLPGVRAYDAAREIDVLRTLVLDAPEVRRAVDAGGPRAAHAIVRADRGPLGVAFDGFLQRHGHRMTGRDLSCPTWREAPELLVALLAADHAAPRPAAMPAPWSAEERRLAATAAIERAIGGALAPLRRAAFRAALAVAQRYVVVRENMRYHGDYFLARLRALALTLGARLLAARRLDAATDVCFLTLEELRGALATSTSLAALAGERRVAFERDARTPPPAVLDASAPPRAAARATPTTDASGRAPDTRLGGDTGAPGRCRAPARLVRGPLDFERVRPGDVIVAAYTDPSWLVVLERASGLVLEVGGQLSHGAIVARELGIPALVNVDGATRTIRDGDTIELDAGAGVATIVRGT